MTVPLPPHGRPRRYSVDELLCLRSELPVVACVVRKLNKHLDIGTIVRIPEQAFNHPDSFFCTSQSLIDVTNQANISQLDKKQFTGSSSEDSGGLSGSLANSNRDKQTQWHLRQRESSDRSTQPHSAPSGIAAQQSENFQRFYRAVVSPTHVRVTAGGRIVPNTRATAPPTLAWNSDKFLFENQKRPPITEQSNPTVATWPQSVALPANFPTLLPTGFAPNYSHLLQGHVTPLAPPMATLNTGAATSNDNGPIESGQSLKINGDASIETSGVGASSQHIKISDPSQFDSSKPFHINGRTVYPHPAGLQLLTPHPLPFTMLGNPNLLPLPPHPVNNFIGQPQHPIAMGPANPLIFPSVFPQHAVPLPNALHSLENLHPLPPYAHAGSGILSVSDLTRYQIQEFRNHLKYIENQLANNKHQIDEGYMTHQRNEVVATIGKMEAMLNAQLDHEGKTVGNGNKERPIDNQLVKGSNIDDYLSLEDHRSMNKHSTLPKEDQPEDAAVKHQSLFMKAASIPVSMSTPQTSKITSKREDPKLMEAVHDTKNSTRSEPVIKSKLSAAAAMAPPFQPRAQALVAANGIPKLGLSSTALGSSWSQPNDLSFAQATGHANLTRGNTVAGTMMQPQDHFPARFQRSHTFHGVPTAFSSSDSTPLIAPNAVPYLVGVLPPGMSASKAQATDLIYSRPLTDEEIRARYLYWGKAPRDVQSGLPKFDGKDFYPPSPFKEKARLVTNTTTPQELVTPLPTFDHVFANHDAAVYRTPSPVPSRSGLQNVAPTPTQIFLENSIIGFQSPSPRPSSYRYEASALPDMLMNHGAMGSSDNNPSTPSANPNASVSEDFTDLFLERGVPGYRSPTPPPPGSEISERKIVENEEIPVTPKNRRLDEETDGEDDETGTLDSWGAPTNSSRWIQESTDRGTSIDPATIDSHSDTSTVEITLSPKVKNISPKHVDAPLLMEQTGGLNSMEQQSLFLQNMLRSTAQATMAAPALSGAISPATAQGYLPQYRGSAAASLAPTVLNIPFLEREGEHFITKNDQTGSSTSGIAPLIAANFLPENRPLNRDRGPRPIRPSPETMGAEGYMRYVSQKATEDKKIIEQGWNAGTTATGPVMGSDW